MTEAWALDVFPGEQVLLCDEVLKLDDPALVAGNRIPVGAALAMCESRFGDWQVFNAAGTLEHHSNLEEQQLFRCLFGRDSLIIAQFLRGSHPAVLLNTVCVLARYQGQVTNDASEEEPGRIPHEVRSADDPQAARIFAEAGWRFPYFGSVDATLLWLKALGDLARQDPATLRLEVDGKSLEMRAQLAATWVVNRIEEGGGDIRSQRRNPRGILNQVWKDSGDSYLTAAGEIADETGTASVETIAEAFDALQSAAAIAELASTEWQLSEAELRQSAHQLKAKLLNEWWLGDRFAMGQGLIDGELRFLDAVASNQWRLLNSGILDVRADRQFIEPLIRSVTDPEILGPTGIRTLGKSNPRFRAGGYHTGSSWPMDSALIVQGLLRHGAIAEATEVANRTIAAIERVGGYPELFRSDSVEPTAVNRYVVDVLDSRTGGANRINQPPQLLQGWTIAAYSWLKAQEFGG